VSRQSTQPCQSLEDLVRKSGRYQAQAYNFVRDGLDNAARTIHGPLTPAQHVVSQFMCSAGVDLHEVIALFNKNQLDPQVAAAVHEAGGLEGLNRNISGQDLCWCLRDFALKLWGMLAPLVLRRWGITSTSDFGRIVFDMVDHGFMQKEAHDVIDDFRDVFDFETAFKGRPARRRSQNNDEFGQNAAD